MKKTFLRILPLAAAVLLATSCSKDNDNATEVVNNGQETVQTKTYPISITVNQKGLSKLSCTGDMGEALQPTFEMEDLLVIYKGEDLLKELRPTYISEDGKTAIFEDEIVANGLVDGETVLTAKIGTPIAAAVTATSREDAVKKGCYQTATFTYLAEGNSIDLEEQNAYIEVVWENKGEETVEFSINGNPVPLDLNGDGQGWIVVPAGVSLTCEALGITDTKTTVKGNIYGITRTFTNISLDKTTASVAIGKTETLTATTVPEGGEVSWESSDEDIATVANGVVTPIKEGTTTITATFGELSATCTVTVIPEGYVDLGVVNAKGEHVYFAESNSEESTWNAINEAGKLDELPTKEEWVALANACYWVWVDDGSTKGMYAYKLRDGQTSNYSGSSFNNDRNYSTTSDPSYIFLPVTPGYFIGNYWSSTEYEYEANTGRAYCLYFNSGYVHLEYDRYKTDSWSVRTVRRSK